MKKDIHPDYKPVIFHDVTCNKSFLLSSTITVSNTHLTLPTIYSV